MAAGDGVAVALVVKDARNPFFTAMQEAARSEAAELGVTLTVAAAAGPTDVDGQVRAIEDAVRRGDEGILVTPVSDGIDSALVAAREAGLYVVALDTPTAPDSGADITFATDNREAGRLLGAWVAGALEGRDARIAVLDLLGDDSVTVDRDRNQGFLEGVGIPLGDPSRAGDEVESGTYANGVGGRYVISCRAASLGSRDGGAAAMRGCLDADEEGADPPKPPTVVYAANDAAALGARDALEEAGIGRALVVSVDGGCEAVDAVEDGALSATAQQYPLRMVTLGLRAVAEVSAGGSRPRTSDGLDFYDTGVALVTDRPVPGVPSLDVASARGTCWG